MEKGIQKGKERHKNLDQRAGVLEKDKVLGLGGIFSEAGPRGSLGSLGEMPKQKKRRKSSGR